MVNNYQTQDEMKFKYGDKIYMLGEYINNSRIRKFNIVKITDVVYSEPANLVYRLDENSPYYSDNQRDYIIRYKKFINWLKENEGKQFVALIDTIDIEESKFDLPQFNAYLGFGLPHYNCRPLKHYFLTDYQLIDLPKFDNIKTEYEWLRALIICLNYYILSEVDYEGKYVL